MYRGKVQELCVTSRTADIRLTWFSGQHQWHWLSSLQWESLESQHIKSNLIYKMQNHLKLGAIPTEYCPAPPRNNRSNDHSQNLQHILATTSTYKHSVYPRTISVWNQQPANLIYMPWTSHSWGIQECPFHYVFLNSTNKKTLCVYVCVYMRVCMHVLIFINLDLPVLLRIKYHVVV